MLLLCLLHLCYTCFNTRTSLCSITSPLPFRRIPSIGPTRLVAVALSSRILPHPYNTPRHFAHLAADPRLDQRLPCVHPQILLSFWTATPCPSYPPHRLSLPRPIRIHRRVPPPPHLVSPPRPPFRQHPRNRPGLAPPSISDLPSATRHTPRAAKPNAVQLALESSSHTLDSDHVVAVAGGEPFIRFSKSPCRFVADFL
jgi:hypothetical protein